MHQGNFFIFFTQRACVRSMSGFVQETNRKKKKETTIFLFPRQKSYKRIKKILNIKQWIIVNDIIGSQGGGSA